MRYLVLLAGILTAILSAACQSPRTAAIATQGSTDPDCPAELQGQVNLAASAVARTIPADLATNEGPVKIYAVLGRRLLVSVAPSGTARGMRVLSSKLTIATFGGMLKGWAAVSGNAGSANAGVGSDGSRADSSQPRAIDVIPGRLRISPFLGATTLRAQTVGLDVLVVPGGVPVDEMAVTLPPMWSADLRPISPDALRVALTPVRHFTAYDLVDATIKLEYVAMRSRFSRERWQCSVETRITLVDRDAVRPPLWDLRESVAGARGEFWLALYEANAGAFRAIFTSPADAAGFAVWLRQTRATRVGEYQLGLFRAEELADARTVPDDRAIMDSFHPALGDELLTLRVGSLGER